MSKNRVIYQSQAIYAGPNKSSGLYIDENAGANVPTQLSRVQSANYNFEITRQDVNQFGNLAAIDRVILDQPTVGLDTSWYVCSLFNEDIVGFKVNQDTFMDDALFNTCIGDMLDRTSDERNYYIRVVKEGSDAAGFESVPNTDAQKLLDNETIGIGNGFLSSYSVEAAVGGFPTATVAVEGLNIVFYDGITGLSPFVTAADGSKNSEKLFALPAAVDSPGSSTKVLKPGDISFELPDTEIGAVASDLKVQSFNINLDLGREPLQKLGSRFAYAREIAFPVTITCSVDALVGDLDTGNLADVIESNTDHTLVFKLNKPRVVAGVSHDQHIAYVLKKAKLDSMDFSNTIGDNKSVSMNFSCQVGSSEQDDVGMFMSGVTTDDSALHPGYDHGHQHHHITPTYTYTVTSTPE